MLALGLGILAALCWGTHDLMVRRIAPGASVLPQLVAVMGVAALVVLPYGLWRGDWSAPDAVGLAAAGAAGVCYLFASLALYMAFARAPARLVAPVIGAYPLPALALAALAGQTISPGDWLAAAIIVAGVMLVATGGTEDAADDDGPAAGRGALPLALLACLGMAVSFTFGHQATLRLDAHVAPTVTRMAVAATGLVLLALRPAGLRATLRQMPVLFAMGCLDGVALTAVVAAGALPMAHYASVVSSLFGMVTILLAWALLGERVGPRQGLGIGLIFGGLAVLALP